MQSVTSTSTRVLATRPVRVTLRPSSRQPMRICAVQNKEKTKPGFAAEVDVPAFTRRREHAAGRIASLGMAADIVGELLTGVGPIHQLSLETGFGPTTLFAGLLLLLSTNLVGGLSPLSKTFTDENQRDVNSRAVDGGLNPNPRKFFAEAEVNIGRAAMTGFLLACVLEFIGGGVAPLSLLHIIPVGSSTLSNGGPFLTLLVALFAVNGFGAFSLFGDYTGEDNDAF